MQVKSYNHQAIAEWSNSKLHSELLACARINPDQNQLYNLDILSLDLSDRSKNLNPVGNAFYDVPFRCLAWDTFGEKENTFPHGIIFGGMENGSYSLWNAAEMISGYGKNEIVKTVDNIENQSAFLYGEDAEDSSYPIMCAQWNSLKNNLLAFGSTDVLILDIGKDISKPEIKKPGTRNPHEGSYVTSVAWNKEVANVFASASENGQIALWDIKTNKSIFEFKDSPSSNAGNRNVVICWSKEISTQLAVTLDDEKRNELQIWDLRNKKGPVAIFTRGHTKGINTMQWSETEPELILTAGRDNKVVCWNYTQDDAPIFSQDVNQAIYDLKWSKKLKSIYSLGLEDRIQIYTMNNNALFNYVPKWYRVPIESAFSGNESIITYSQSQGQKLTETSLSSLASSSSQSQIHELLNELEASLDESSLEEKAKESDFWNLINIKNSSQGDDLIYDYLGFNKEKIVKEVEKYTGKKRDSVLIKAETQTKQKAKAYTPVIGQEAASFFASIGQNDDMKTSGIAASDDQDNENIKYDMVPRNFNWNIGKEKLIKQNILIGNYEGAIDAALKCGRTAEALIIAYSIDQNTFTSTLKTFFTETTDNFITDILRNITYKDNEELIKQYDLDSWKECVAMIYSLSTSEKRKALLNLLAARIREESLRKTGKSSIQVIAQDNPAIQCYILSQNFNEIANLYFDNLKGFESGTTQRKEVVLEYAKRLILIFNSLSIEIEPSRNFHKILREAAFIATEENFKNVAYILFSTFLYDTSMKEVDMIIHASKNLEEYRNSVVFPQINIPVMQFQQPQHNQPQGQQGQRGKRGPQEPPQQQQHAPNVPPKLGQRSQPVNPNVPTKDKNAPRPPIFNNQRGEQPEIQNPRSGMVPPPPPQQGRPRTQTQTYEEEQPEVVNTKKTPPPKKVPPPPGFKQPPPPQQKIQEAHYGQQPYQNQAPEQAYEQQSQRKVQPPTIKGKKMPPPPPTGFGNEIKEQVGLVHSSQEMKKPPPARQEGSRMPPPPPVHQVPQQQQQVRPPPPQNRMPKPPKQHQSFQNQPYQQQQQEQEEQPQQSRSQQYYQQPNLPQTKSVKPPPPPQGIRPPPPMSKGSMQVPSKVEREEQDTSFTRGSSESYHKPPEFQSGKKTMPPPPPVKREPVQQQQQHQQQYNTQYEQEEEPVSRQTVKPPPPGGKSGVKTPPPPPVSRQQVAQMPKPPQQFPAQQQQHFPPPPSQQFGSQQQQFHPQQPHYQQSHNQQAYQQPYQQQSQSYEQPQQQAQYETPIIKRPPPPVSGKKGPPPPPRR